MEEVLKKLTEAVEVYNADNYVEEIVPITTANYNDDGCTFTFKFNRTIDFKKGSKVGLVNCSMYNSTANITSFYGNNKLTLKWINGDTVNITIPDGYYSYSDLTFLIQHYLIENNFYYVKNNVAIYPFTISENIPLYKAQLNINYIPSAMEALAKGYTKPPGATWDFPLEAKTPEISFNAGLGKIMGFQQHLSFPVDGPQEENYAVLSDVFPTISPVYMYVLSLNLLNTELSTTHNNIFTAVALNNGFGQLVTFGNGSVPQMVDIHPSKYSEIRVRFLDQNLNPIKLIDPELSLLLVIKHRK